MVYALFRVPNKENFGCLTQIFLVHTNEIVSTTINSGYQDDDDDDDDDDEDELFLWYS